MMCLWLWHMFLVNLRLEISHIEAILHHIIYGILKNKHLLNSFMTLFTQNINNSTLYKTISLK
jgi:hypothetical protein